MYLYFLYFIPAFEFSKQHVNFKTGCLSDDHANVTNPWRCWFHLGITMWGGIEGVAGGILSWHMYDTIQFPTLSMGAACCLWSTVMKWSYLWFLCGPRNRETASIISKLQGDASFFCIIYSCREIEKEIYSCPFYNKPNPAWFYIRGAPPVSKLII